eukprot:g3052.t1
MDASDDFDSLFGDQDGGEEADDGAGNTMMQREEGSMGDNNNNNDDDDNDDDDIFEDFFGIEDDTLSPDVEAVKDAILAEKHAAEHRELQETAVEIAAADDGSQECDILDTPVPEGTFHDSETPMHDTTKHLNFDDDLEGDGDNDVTSFERLQSPKGERRLSVEECDTATKELRAALVGSRPNVEKIRSLCREMRDTVPSECRGLVYPLLLGLPARSKRDFELENAMMAAGADLLPNHDELRQECSAASAWLGAGEKLAADLDILVTYFCLRRDKDRYIPGLAALVAVLYGAELRTTGKEEDEEGKAQQSPSEEIAPSKMFSCLYALLTASSVFPRAHAQRSDK